MKKILIIIFGSFVVLVLGVFIFNLLENMDRKEYQVDKDYQSTQVAVEITVTTNVEEASKLEANERTLSENDEDISVKNTESIDVGETSKELSADNNDAEGNRGTNIDVVNETANLIDINAETNTDIDAGTENNNNSDIDTTSKENNELNKEEAADPEVESEDDTQESAIDSQTMVDIKNSSFQDSQGDTTSLKFGVSEEDEYANYTGDEWVDNQVSEHIEEIDEEDLSSGLAISEKVDIEVIFEFIDDGLTEEEKEELMEYLRSRLTDAEIQQMEGLFYKYEYILDE